MHENGGRARVFQDARQVRRSQVLIIPAQAHFGGDGDFDGLDHAAHQLRRFVHLRHHGRAAANAADLAHRAAHVNIDRRHADGFKICGGIAHFLRDGAEKLDGQRLVGGAGFDEFEGFGISFQERAGVDKIGGGEVQLADFAHDQAERQVGITCQRRQK